MQRTGEVVGSNLLGLTVGCAKCHNHKYEPISQRDYYRLLAIFSPALNPDHWITPKDRALPDVALAEKARVDAHNAQLDHQVRDIEKRLAAIRKPYEERLFEARLLELPEAIREDTKRAFQTAGDKRDEIQRYLASRFQAALRVKPAEITAALSDEDKRKSAEIDREIAAVRGRRLSYGTIQALYDVGPPGDTHLLRRGNPDTPGEVVQPGFFAVLCDPHGAQTAAVKPAGNSSGRRLALAHWLTDWETPAGGLVARVAVNRVWQHLFGKGIVETVDNFGVSGAPPTHPELLEWLASQYVRKDRRLKPLIKLLMTSSVYRQSSASRGKEPAPGGGPLAGPATDPGAIDPGNRLLWHMRLRRLESELVRDSLLSAAGNLDRTLYGPPLPIENRADGMVVLARAGPACRRRPIQRGQRQTASPGPTQRRRQIAAQHLCARPAQLPPVDAQRLRPAGDGHQLPRPQPVGGRAAVADDVERCLRSATGRRVCRAGRRSCRSVARSADRVGVSDRAGAQADRGGVGLESKAAGASRARLRGHPAGGRAPPSPPPPFPPLPLPTNEFLYVQ